MTQYNRIFGIIVASFALAFPAIGQDGFTAGDLRRYCDSDTAEDSAFCFAYVAGFLQGVTMEVAYSQKVHEVLYPNSNINTDVFWFYCNDGEDSITSGFLAVKNYLGAHPELENESAALVIYDALAEEFPCS